VIRLPSTSTPPCPACGRLAAPRRALDVPPPSRDEVDALAEERLRTELGHPPWIEHLNYAAALVTLTFVCIGIPGGLSDALRYFGFAALVMVGGATLQRTILKEQQRQADAYRLRRSQLAADCADEVAARYRAALYCAGCDGLFLPAGRAVVPRRHLRSFLLRGEYPSRVQGGPT
jgi:hypothetical protein